MTLSSLLDSMKTVEEIQMNSPRVIPSLQEAGVPHLCMPLRWYVMRATYSREMKARDMLEREGVNCFVPIKTAREITSNGETKAIERPMVRNYIFVRTTRSFMDEYKRKVEEKCPLRYVIDKSTGMPMVVSEKEMEDFIRVTTNASDEIQYLDNIDRVLSLGKNVEVIAGHMAGVQGKVVRFRGNRRVVVSLAGMVGVALGSMPISWLKIIE